MKLHPKHKHKKVPKTNTKQRKRTKDTTLTKNQLNSFLCSAKPNLFLLQSKAMKCLKKTGYPKMTLLLKVFLMFRMILDFSSFQTRLERGMLMFLPPKSKQIVSSLIFCNFFLGPEHQRKQDLLLTLHLYYLADFPKTALMAASGSPMYEAESVSTAVRSSGVSVQVSSPRSYIPMSLILGSFPKPSSSIMSIQVMLLQPVSVFLAVRSPIVMLLL